MSRNIKIPQACFIIIGDEILSGRTVDANLPVLAKLLNQKGIRLAEVRIIPDKKEKIIHTILECRAAFDEVFTSGGIGPTHDDITAASIAEAFDLPLERNENVFEQLKKTSKNGTCNKMKEKMAWFPKGSRLVENNAAAPPGFTIGNVHVMAGVPRIFASMAQWLIPRLSTKGVPLCSMAWHCFHLGESEFAEELEALQQKIPDAEIGSYPFSHHGKQGITLVAKGYNPQSVRKAAASFPEIMKRHGVKPEEGEFKA